VVGTRLGLMLEYQKSPHPGTAHRAAGVFGSQRNECRCIGMARGRVRAGVNMRTRILNPGAYPPSRPAQRIPGALASGREFTVTPLGSTIMLSRTADHLFWMARYMERAENTARMLDVNYQMSLLPQSAEQAEQGWRGVLGISELTDSFAARYPDFHSRHVMEFMVRDAGNASSITACVAAARENARAVRGALTTEVWETTNQTWLEFSRLLAQGDMHRDPSALFEWVKFRSHLSRGVTVGTMLQDEALHFLRIGTFLERADNTARLLDVKFQSLAGDDYFGPRAAMKEASKEAVQEVDFYHWSAVLRSVSGFEVYRKVYRNVIRPDRVAELLILRPDMPRSLAACMNALMLNLGLVANAQSSETLRRAGRLQSDLQYGRIDEILATGLHAYLTQFLDRVGDLGVGISRDFLVPMAA
jgi:uncharacterized alpha-E superfamily protein